MARCKSCGCELYTRRQVDGDGKATGTWEITCRNPGCPEADGLTVLSEAELDKLEEEEVAQWGV